MVKKIKLTPMEQRVRDHMDKITERVRLPVSEMDLLTEEDFRRAFLALFEVISELQDQVDAMKSPPQ